LKARRAGLVGAMVLGLGSAGAAEPPLRIAALGTVLAEVAAQVGGPDVRVDDLIPPGIDPHTFNPSPADLRSLVDADLVLASGLGMEGYLDRLAVRIGSAHRVLAVGDTLPGILAGPQGEKDPHWWNSVVEVEHAVDTVRAALAAARPDESQEFAARAAAYTGRLETLRRWVEGEVGRIPRERRQLVTSHDAFAYFARDYGFTIHAISGLSTEGEADARHVAALIDLVRRDRVRAIFAESSANPRLVSNLMEETGVRLAGTLYADGLGAAGSDAQTYEGMVRHNVRTIVEGLLGP
jgi:zinc/manganese transport system substrate-binding protein